MIKRKCTWCGKLGKKQTVRGKENQDSKGLPQNDGWFCEKCWRDGYEMEMDAMLGECRYNCKC